MAPHRYYPAATCALANAGATHARMRRGLLISIAALLAGCATIPAQQAGQSGVIAPASHVADITPPKLELPKLELPDWQLPEVDWSRLNPDRQPSNDRDW